MNKIILTDVDGVLVDWLSDFEQYIKDNIDFKIDTDGVIGHLNVEQRYNLTPQKADELVCGFIRSTYIQNLPAIRNSAVVIPELHDKGFKFLALTSISDDPEIKKNRMINLNKLYGEKIFIDCWCLPTGKNKLNELKSIKETYGDEIVIWVEDHMENAVDGYNIGFDTFIMDHSYNRSLDHVGIKRARNWNDIQRYLMKKYK